ncbi:MAG: HAMP domain-containing histidine kinase [Oscillospiraceae bacterium]|nr:HAMP domain-containing histidine kinase [Oscillospiraceae bacterium]
MKAFNRIFLAVTILVISVFAVVNIIFLRADDISEGRPYRVEISRIVHEIEKNGIDSINLSDYEYVTAITEQNDDFYSSESDYMICEINGNLYRFDYSAKNDDSKTKTIMTLNTIIGIMTVIIFSVMFYVKYKILSPFEKLTDVPYELSKGNLTSPVQEIKNRFFGKFIWGVDMLRENMEKQKERELNLQREKKMLLLSLSHDIKTPLSAIKLYSKALSKGLYESREKQLEIAESINTKADEIEGYVSEIITASREDFLSLDVNVSEFYLSELVNKINLYYKEKLSLVHTEFTISEYADCLIKGDCDRCIEVIQNVIENAVKYGDGRKIAINFSEEEGCILVSVTNSGNTLEKSELTHIFESFWRGTNAENVNGSGLGLYICRQLMRKMNGEIFAEINDENISVISVFTKA